MSWAPLRGAAAPAPGAAAPAPRPVAPGAPPPWAKRRRISLYRDADETVEARRSRLRSALKDAAVKGVETLVDASQYIQRQELSFDEGMDPALEFMWVMGLSPAAVFCHLLGQLRRLFADCLRGKPREVLERVLTDMLLNADVSHVRDLVVAVVQHLVKLPAPRGEAERQAICRLGEAFLRDRASLEQLPHSLQRRVWEEQPELIADRVEPLAAEWVRGMRERLGVLMIDLKQKPPELRRREDKLLQRLAELVGTSASLYRAVRQFLQRRFEHAADSGGPALRLPAPARGGADTRAAAAGAPVSLGREPLLASLRSQLLLVLVDRGVLRQSFGPWAVTSTFREQSLSYGMRLTVRGGRVSGTSELQGISEVNGTLDGSRLVFRQVGEGVSYHCSCTVSDDQQRLLDGVWHVLGTSLIAGEQGYFTASREGPVVFLDAAGEAWDPVTPLVVALDRVHQQKSGIDAATLASLQQIFRGRRSAAAGGADAVPSHEDVRLALMDPCVVQSVLRGLLASRSCEDGLLGPEARFALWALMACHDSAPVRSADPADLLGSVPSATALAAAGLQCGHVAATLQKHRHCNLCAGEPGAAATLNAELVEMLRGNIRALPERVPALTVARLLLNALMNKSLLFKHREAFQSCLLVAADVERELAQPGSALDWVMLQQVDMLVGTALHLRDKFDTGLRKTVTEHLFALARRDPWVHSRVAKLLEVYQLPSFASSREEINSLTETLNHGALKDKHYDWSVELSEAYVPVLRNKAHLTSIYRDCRLWRQAVHGGAAVTAPGGAPLPPSAGGAAGPASLGLSASVGSRDALSAEDAIVAPRVCERVRKFCTEGGSTRERALEAASLLSDSFRGHHWVSYLVAKWIVALGVDTSLERSHGWLAERAARASPAPPWTPERILRSLLRRKMVAEFNAHKADPLLMPVNGVLRIPSWLDPFIQVPEWRMVVYELTKEFRGQSSSFLLAVLLQMSEAESYKEELASNPSSTSNFIVFCRTFRTELTRFFDLLNKDASLVTCAIDDFCKVCSFSEYTYVYSQAVLHRLMCVRPEERPYLQYVSQALTDAAMERSSNVLRQDLRFKFSSAGEYSEIFSILQSMSRFGRHVKVEPGEVSKLSGLVQGLLDWAVPGPQGPPTQPPPKAHEEAPGAAPPSASKAPSEGGTEAMSDAGSWLDPEDRDEWAAPPSDGPTPEPGLGAPASEGGGRALFPATGSVCESEPDEDGEGRSRRVQISVAGSSLMTPKDGSTTGTPRRPGRPSATPTGLSERTASIFHMPAVSSAASGGARPAPHDAGQGAVGFPESPEAQGLLQALRCPHLLEAVLARFLEPSSVLGAWELRAFARLLAAMTVDGLWPGLGADKPGHRDLARGTMAACAEELERVYQVAHHPQNLLVQKVAALIQLQTHAVASLAGLRWLTQVALAKTLAPAELLTRMSQSAVFVLLRRACDAHPLQLGSVLRVLGHMLELLPCAGREVDERGEEEEEVVLEDRQDVWRSGVAGGGGLPGDAEMGSPQLARVRRMIAASLAYLAAAPDGCMQVLEFVRAHEGQWGGEELRLFLADLLPCIAPPYSVRFVSAVARLLDRPAAWAFGGGEDAAAKELPSIAGRFAEDCRRCLEELPQETQTALAAVEARLAGRALSEARSPPKHQIGVDAVGLVPAAVSDATVVAPTGQAPAEPDADELMGLELWSWWNRKKGAAKVAPKPQEGPLTLKPMKSKGKRTRAPSARPGRRRHAEGNSDDCDEDSDPNQGAAPRAPAAAVPRLRRARTASRRLSPGVDEDDDAEEEFDFSRSARAAASGPPPACPGPRVARSRSRGAGGSGSDTESVRQPSEDCAAEPPTAECSRGSGGRQQAATAPPATAQPRAGGLWDSAERSGAERTAVPPGQPGGAGDGALASRARKVKRLAFHSMLAGAPAAAPGPTALAEPPSFSSNTSPTVGRSPTPGTAASPRARPAATAAAGPAARDAASSAQARAASGVTAEPSAPMVPGAAAMPVCPWVGGEDSGIRLDAELMQGTWLHSYGGEVTVVGAAVMWKGNQLGDLVAQPGGVFELAGWVADPGRSSPDRVLWTHPSLPVCCWDRPNAQKDSAE